MAPKLQRDSYSLAEYTGGEQKQRSKGADVATGEIEDC
jgi:hypothetical protein